MNDNKTIKEAIASYNLTLETEIMIENIAGVQADYFRLLDKEEIDIKSTHPLSIISVELSNMKNKLLLLDNMDDFNKVVGKLQLAKTILTKCSS